MFSILFVGLVWLIVSVAIRSSKRENELFQIILAATLLNAMLGGLFFNKIFSFEFSNISHYLIDHFIIFSAMSSILFLEKIKGNN